MRTITRLLLLLNLVYFSFSRALVFFPKNATETRRNEPEVQISIHIEPDRIWKLAVVSYFLLIFIGVLVNCFLIFYCDPCLLPLVLWIQGEDEVDCLEHYVPPSRRTEHRNTSSKDDFEEINELHELL